MKKHPARDLYQDVTNRILKLLDQGTVPWRNPIRKTGGRGWPKNLDSGKRYRGINIFLLATKAWEEGFQSDYWLTFKQAQQQGGQVRKGEKSTLIVFWKQVVKTDRQTDEETIIPVLKHYNVFNAQQCDGIEPPDAHPAEESSLPFEPLERAEQIVANYRDSPQIEHRGQRAVYRPAWDLVEIAEPQKFDSRESYYSTLYHELAHSSGHSKRLNRGLDTNLTPFGSPDYGKEELIAEMSAAFLSAAAGISPPTIEQSAAYIDNWRRVIKADKRLVITAAGAAQKATDWILGENYCEISEQKPSISSETVEPKPTNVSTPATPRKQLELF